MVVEQKALVEEALLARTRLRARRAYVQARKGGANRAVAFEAAVDSLLEADHTISEAEARANGRFARQTQGLRLPESDFCELNECYRI